MPWDYLINPVWAELVPLVEEAWLALDSGFMHQDEERLPLACLPDAIASPPPMELPRTNQTFFERHFPRLLTLVVLARLGRWGLAVIAATRSRRLSSSACNALPAFAGGIHLLAYVPVYT